MNFLPNLGNPRRPLNPSRWIAGLSGLCFALALWLVGIQPADAASAREGSLKPRPRIGLVLSGGGARGLAHIGILQVLEQQRIPVDYIAATSMGAIVGGAYASGMSVDGMERFVTQVDWSDVFRDYPQREDLSFRRKELDRKNFFGLELGFREGQFQLPIGAIAGQKLDLVMDELGERAISVTDFNKLPIPFRSVATNLETGEMFVFDHGSLATAMRASMSVPGALTPIDYQGQLLVDGGLVRNLPVDIARDMGAEVIIAVNLGTPLLRKENLGSIFGVTVQMVNILTEQNVQKSLASLRKRDVLILPELLDISAADFERAKEAIQSGVEAAVKAIPKLQQYQLSPELYAVYQTRRQPRVPQQARIVDEVRFEQLNRVNPKILEDLLMTQPGESLDKNTLKEDLARLYGRGDFERINYRYFQEAGRGVVAINAFEKSWGPNYLRFGLGLESDFQGTTNFNARTSYDVTWLNRQGAEWRNDLQIGQNTLLNTEFFQPFAADSRWFVAPFLRYEDRIENIFEGNRKFSEYGITSIRLGVDVGRQLNNWGKFRVGLSAGHIDSSIDSGPNVLPALNVFQGALTGSLVVDTLDNPRFPRKGNLGVLQTLASLDALGSNDQYIKVDGSWNHAFSSGPHVFNIAARAGTRFEGDLPPYDELILGGFLQLSGYRLGQLRGQDLAFGRLVYQRQLIQLPGTLGDGLYAGGSLEAGNVWNDFSDTSLDTLNTGASVFLGADTILGPLYLGYGYAGTTNNSFYLLLGTP